MPLGRFGSPEELLVAAVAYAKRQRASDYGKSETGRPQVSFRKKSDMCLAYSIADDYFYVGYSAIAGGIIGGTGDRKKPYVNHQDRDQPQRRFYRAKRTIKAKDMLSTGPLGRPLANCAEVCALSIADSWGQSVGNLIFIAFYPEFDARDRKLENANELKAPCDNCKSWLSSALGYYEGGETGFVFRR